MLRKPYFLYFLLSIQTVALIVYTLIAFQTEGATLFTVFLSNVKSFTWSGQFNLDFLCYLTLSALWITWRNQFSGSSILIGLLAAILGIVFFAPYLIWLLIKESGDLKRVLIGNR